MRTARSARRDVQRACVGVGVDRDALDPGLAAGADDADGDLAAVGDEHALQARRCHCHRASTAPAASRGTRACLPGLPRDTRCRAMVSRRQVCDLARAAGRRPARSAPSRRRSRPAPTSAARARSRRPPRRGPPPARRRAPGRSRARARPRNAPPVRNSSRAADAPIFATAKGEITAGRIPSFTSVNPNMRVLGAPRRCRRRRRGRRRRRAPRRGCGRSAASAACRAPRTSRAIALASRTFSSCV